MPSNAKPKIDLSEEAVENNDVEILVPAQPVKVDDVVVGTVALHKIVQRSYKTGEPTGEKLVFAVFQPNNGRKVSVRWKYAEAMVEAINATLE
jgi:hypothetical protein